MNQTSFRIAMPVVALASALAAPGRADAQLTTELGGSVAFQAGIFDNDKPGEIHRAFRTDVELRLRVLGQMDNGTLYGSEIQLEVPDNTRSVISMDEAYLFIAAKWGRIELGDEDGAMSKMAIHAPSVGLGQLDGDYDQFTTEFHPGPCTPVLCRRERKGDQDHLLHAPLPWAAGGRELRAPD